MSVFVGPSKPLDPYSPLPLLALQSLPLPTHDYGPPPTTTTAKPKKHKKEDKKKKKPRPKRSKSCPPIEETKSSEESKNPKKLRFPIVESKKNPKEASTAVVAKSKPGKSAPVTRSHQPGSTVHPATPPPQVRLITLAKLREEDIREKLRQTVFKISTRAKSGESGGLIVVDGNKTDRRENCHRPYQSFCQSLSNQDMDKGFEEPPAILKHRRFAFNRQLSDGAKDRLKNNVEVVELNSKNSCRLKKQFSLELPHEKLSISENKQGKVQPQKPSGNARSKQADAATQVSLTSTHKCDVPGNNAQKPGVSSNNTQKSVASTNNTQKSGVSINNPQKPGVSINNTQKPGVSTNNTQKSGVSTNNAQKPGVSSAKVPHRQPSSPLTSSSAESNPQSPSKSKKNISLLVKIKPVNQETERERFFSSNFTYNPQFEYRSTPTQNEMERFSQASASLLHIAIKIMRVATKKYGTYEKFEEKTGGAKLSRSQIAEAAHTYLKNENLQDEVTLMLSDDLLSRACMSRMNGKPTLLVRTGCMRQHWVLGMLRHEIGTHYLRSCNNKHQVWSHSRKRKELDMLPLNPTEEGLASLHSVIFREDPNLWRCAFLYYVIYQASRMSFVELFKDVAQFVKDPGVRWDYCLRAKRGMEDTSQPGAFCKDQVYLKGALQILRHRRTIDFHLLIKAGKVDFRDLDKLRYVVDPEKTRIPSFMQDIYIYRLKLEEIFTRNRLTDAELESIEELDK